MLMDSENFYYKRIFTDADIVEVLSSEQTRVLQPTVVSITNWRYTDNRNGSKIIHKENIRMWTNELLGTA